MLEIFSIPLGSPKYIPPVSSLIINISKLLIISGFKLDDSINESNTIAGLKLAKRSSSFLILRRPLSGLFSKGSFSHFGPPTAPKRIASVLVIFSNVFSERGVSFLSIDSPPTKSSIISIFRFVLLFNQLNIFLLSFEISCPMPSLAEVL